MADYYKVGDMELIDIMEQTYGSDRAYSFCLLNVLKYVMRCERKHPEPFSDLHKAEWYLGRAIELRAKIAFEGGLQGASQCERVVD